MVAMNFTPTNEPMSPRKHSVNSLDSIPERDGGTDVVNSRHGNQSNGVSKHVDSSAAGIVGGFGGTTTSRPTDNSLVNHTVPNHTSVQGNTSRKNSPFSRQV